MSLRYIPDSTKVSPFEMVIRSLKRFDKDRAKEEKKRKESYAYIMLMQKIFNLLGVENAFIGMYMDGFLIEDSKPKNIIAKLNKSLFEEFFAKGFDKPAFQAEFSTLLNKVSAKYNIANKNDLVIKIIKTNEAKSVDLFKNAVISNTPEEYVVQQKQRLEELKLANMILVSASPDELRVMQKDLKDSTLFNMMTANEDFNKMRNIYQSDLQNELKQQELVKKKQMEQLKKADKKPASRLRLPF